MEETIKWNKWPECRPQLNDCGTYLVQLDRNGQKEFHVMDWFCGDSYPRFSGYGSITARADDPRPYCKIIAVAELPKGIQ